MKASIIRRLNALNHEFYQGFAGQFSRSREVLQPGIPKALAKLGSFKSMSDFEWDWPKKIDRELIEEVLGLGFLDEAANVVLVGPNGVGKSMIAKNLAYEAVLKGHTARFTTASDLLNDLLAQEGGRSLAARLKHYYRPGLLVIDEVGYLSATARHADLLFEVSCGVLGNVEQMGWTRVGARLAAA